METREHIENFVRLSLARQLELISTLIEPLDEATRRDLEAMFGQLIHVPGYESRDDAVKAIVEILHNPPGHVVPMVELPKEEHTDEPRRVFSVPVTIHYEADSAADARRGVGDQLWLQHSVYVHSYAVGEASPLSRDMTEDDLVDMLAANDLPEEEPVPTIPTLFEIDLQTLARTNREYYFCCTDCRDKFRNRTTQLAYAANYKDIAPAGAKCAECSQPVHPQEAATIVDQMGQTIPHDQLPPVYDELVAAKHAAAIPALRIRNYEGKDAAVIPFCGIDCRSNWAASTTYAPEFIALQTVVAGARCGQCQLPLSGPQKRPTMVKYDAHGRHEWTGRGWAMQDGRILSPQKFYNEFLGEPWKPQRNVYVPILRAKDNEEHVWICCSERCRKELKSHSGVAWREDSLDYVPVGARCARCDTVLSVETQTLKREKKRRLIPIMIEPPPDKPALGPRIHYFCSGECRMLASNRVPNGTRFSNMEMPDSECQCSQCGKTIYESEG